MNAASVNSGLDATAKTADAAAADELLTDRGQIAALDARSLSVLISFFQLLDKWDREAARQ
jgi:hypothetical protein